MKALLALILLGLLTACASKSDNNVLQDPSQMKADAKAREEFAKSLPKPRE